MLTIIIMIMKSKKAQLGIKHYIRKHFLPGVLTKFGYNLVWLESGHMVAVTT